jgi:hypothetical protein
MTGGIQPPVDFGGLLEMLVRSGVLPVPWATEGTLGGHKRETKVRAFRSQPQRGLATDDCVFLAARPKRMSAVRVRYRFAGGGVEPEKLRDPPNCFLARTHSGARAEFPRPGRLDKTVQKP